MNTAKTMTKGSLFISLALVLPVAFALLAHQGSCKSNSKGQAGNQGNKQTRTAVPQGIWGGVHVRMEVGDKSTAIEYDCAHGMISEPLVLNSEGRFQARGTYVREHGGPVRQGETPASQPANYSGNVSGKSMTLMVTLTDSSESIGTFTLTQGSEGRIFKCR